MPVDAPPATDVALDAHEAVSDAALECFARWGLAKTTLEDIGREAGLSRATVYRLYPGGKSALVLSVAERELARLLDVVTRNVGAATDIESAVVSAMVAGARFVAQHRALNFLLEHDRAAILPFVAFDRLEPALLTTRLALLPAFAEFVTPEQAEELIEWTTRMTLSLIFAPGSVDPTDHHQVAEFVRSFLAPGQHISPEIPATSLLKRTSST